MPVGNLVSQAIEEMKKTSYQELYIQSISYLEKINSIYSKLEMLESTSTIGQLGEIYRRGSVNATTILESDSFQVAYNKVLLDGYHLLTEIGTWINNSNTLTYNVTVTGNIDGISTKISWNEMPFEQFAEFVDFSSSSRLVMASSNSIMNQMKKQQQNNNQIQTWSPEKIQQYELFKRIARNVGPLVEDKKLTKEIRQMFKDDKQPGKIREFFKWTKQYKRKWRDVNEGNMLEAFTRFQGYNTYLEPQAVFRAMHDTMSNPDPFYKGGDIGDIQIKGDHATVAYHSTILSTLYQTQNTLSKLTSVLKSNQLNESTNQVGSNISANVSKAIDKHIQELVQKYLKTIQR